MQTVPFDLSRPRGRVARLASHDSLSLGRFFLLLIKRSPAKLIADSSPLNASIGMFRAGGTQGIIVFENSQVSIAHVVGRDPGYTPLGIDDSSDVHVEHCLFEDSSGAPWHVGIDPDASHLTIYRTVIRNMQVGMNARANSVIDVQAFDTYSPFGGPSDVTIDSPAGTNFDGASLDSGASLNVSAKLLINQPGQSWGGTTAGVLVSNGSTLNASNTNLVITGSHGQGIVVVNNSHATLAGANVTGGGHGGLVLANLSSIDVGPGSMLTLICGNGVDLFCDSGSTITGSANIAGVPTSQCVQCACRASHLAVDESGKQGSSRFLGLPFLHWQLNRSPSAETSCGRADQVDLPNAVVWIPDSKTPNGTAEVPLTPLAVEAFRR